MGPWNPANQLRLVVYPIIYRVSAPSQVVSQISAINSRILKGPGVVIPLMFPKVPQSSQTESSGFPRNIPSPWTPRDP